MESVGDLLTAAGTVVLRSFTRSSDSPIFTELRGPQNDHNEIGHSGFLISGSPQKFTTPHLHMLYLKQISLRNYKLNLYGLAMLY